MVTERRDQDGEQPRAVASQDVGEHLVTNSSRLLWSGSEQAETGRIRGKRRFTRRRHKRHSDRETATKRLHASRAIIGCNATGDSRRTQCGKPLRSLLRTTLVVPARQRVIQIDDHSRDAPLV